MAQMLDFTGMRKFGLGVLLCSVGFALSARGGGEADVAIMNQEVAQASLKELPEDFTWPMETAYPFSPDGFLEYLESLYDDIEETRLERVVAIAADWFEVKKELGWPDDLEEAKEEILSWLQENPSVIGEFVQAIEEALSLPKGPAFGRDFDELIDSLMLSNIFPLRMFFSDWSVLTKAALECKAYEEAAALLESLVSVRLDGYHPMGLIDALTLMVLDGILFQIFQNISSEVFDYWPEENFVGYLQEVSTPPFDLWHGIGGETLLAWQILQIMDRDLVAFQRMVLGSEPSRWEAFAFALYVSLFISLEEERDKYVNYQKQILKAFQEPPERWLEALDAVEKPEEVFEERRLSPLAGFYMDWIRIATAQLEVVVKARMFLLANALQRHFEENGILPDELSELDLGDELEILIDPMVNEGFRYERGNGRFTLRTSERSSLEWFLTREL